MEIRGIVGCVPPRIVHNHDFLPLFTDADISSVTRNTGVAERRWCDDGVDAGDLCEKAADTLLDRLGWERESVNLLVMVTQTPRYRMPATACELAHNLRLPNEVAAFDVSMACSGYIYGLWLTLSLMRGGSSQRAILLSGDTVSRMTNKKDRATAMLFGDAGTATAIEWAGGMNSPNRSHFILGTDGSKSSALLCEHDGGITMRGSDVFDFSQSIVPRLYGEIETLSGWTGYGRRDPEPPTVVFHQASKFIIERLVKKLKLPRNLAPINIEKFGNTSSASIPLVIADKLDERMTLSDLPLTLLGFGAGLSYGAANILIPRNIVSGLVEY